MMDFMSREGSGRFRLGDMLGTGVSSEFAGTLHILFTDSAALTR